MAESRLGQHGAFFFFFFSGSVCLSVYVEINASLSVCRGSWPKSHGVQGLKPLKAHKTNPNISKKQKSSFPCLLLPVYFMTQLRHCTLGLCDEWPPLYWFLLVLFWHRLKRLRSEADLMLGSLRLAAFGPLGGLKSQ